ncbi:MAG: hypothetical protein HY253_14305 [Burkholderiales bacterium]|nr:hypothetical protein [Burkholderiales bacterium]
MEEKDRQEILNISHVVHAMTETAYQQHSAVRGDPTWADKQRILLADMALHLLQTALHDGELSQDHLRRNLFSILNIADQFVDGHDLKVVADGLLETKSA